jgi:acyl-CoA thioester hydrolase
MTAPIRTKLRVRYAETDQMGVVYYANYFVWCEIGRVEFFRQLGHDYKRLEMEDDCHLPVVEASCRYRSPARYDDEVCIETRVTLLRGAVIKFGYRLLRVEGESERLLAEAETVHVSVDKQMQKRNLPDRYAIAIRGTMV